MLIAGFLAGTLAVVGGTIAYLLKSDTDVTSEINQSAPISEGTVAPIEDIDFGIGDTIGDIDFNNTEDFDLGLDFSNIDYSQIDFDFDIDFSGLQDADLNLDLGFEELDLSGVSIDGLEESLDDTINIGTLDFADDVVLFEMPEAGELEQMSAFKTAEELDAGSIYLKSYLLSVATNENWNLTDAQWEALQP